MKIQDIPKIIEDLSEEDLLNVVFYHSLFSLCNNAIEIHKNKDIAYPFVIESIYEYFMRFNKNGEKKLTNQLFGDISLTIFRTPKDILDKYGTDNLMTLFYLWQIEDQSYLFSRLYRYDWIFNFKNQKVDMPKAFMEKFGCNYIAFEMFCVLIIGTFIGIRESTDEEQRAYCDNIKNAIILEYRNVIKQLTTTREQYVKDSKSVCKNIDLLPFALKMSKLFPFADDSENIRCPMPHTIIPACTTSLLFRLTEHNDPLHGLISKEVLEEYCYHLLSSQNYYSAIKREIPFGKGSLSSDVLVVEKGVLYCIEVKAFTPNTKTRLLDPADLSIQIDEVVEAAFELYKFIFINYPENDEFLSKYNRDNRFGILALREDASFDRRILYTRLFTKICESTNMEISEDDKAFIIAKIKFSSLGEIENTVFTNTRLSTIVGHYSKKGNEMNYTAQSSLNKRITNKQFLQFEKKIQSISQSVLKIINDTYKCA